MKNFKKYLALALAAVLLVAGTFAATVAWMTADADAKKNVFTVGEISIDLQEETDVIGEGGEVNENEDGAEYVGVMPGDRLVKEVSLTNTGNVPVYAALIVTVNNALEINKAIDVYYENLGYTAEQIQNVYSHVFEGWGINYNKVDAEGNALGMRLTITGEDMPEGAEQVDSVKTISEYTNAYNGNWFENKSIIIPYNGVHSGGNDVMGIPAMNDYEIRYTYYVELQPGETFVPFTGLNAPAYFNNAQMAMFEDLTITVDAAAIQADNFATAESAMAALYGIEVPAIPDVVTDDLGDLSAALSNGNYILLNDSVEITKASASNAYGATGLNMTNGGVLDGNGETISIQGAGGTWDSGINTTGGTIKNVKVTGSFRGIFINHNSTHSEPVILENVILDGTVYTISCDQGMNQTLTATDCTFNGWTSYAATLGEATFINCSFGEGRGYAYCRPYAPTTFVGCDFEAGYEMDARAAVTFENCTIGGEPLTADNLATLVTSNTANATVK